MARKDQGKAGDTTRNEAIFAKLRDETSAEVKMCHPGWDSEAARHCELLASICNIVESREERTESAAETLVFAA